MRDCAHPMRVVAHRVHVVAQGVPARTRYAQSHTSPTCIPTCISIILRNFDYILFSFIFCIMKPNMKKSFSLFFFSKYFMDLKKIETVQICRTVVSELKVEI